MSRRDPCLERDTIGKAFHRAIGVIFEDTGCGPRVYQKLDGPFALTQTTEAYPDSRDKSASHTVTYGDLI